MEGKENTASKVPLADKSSGKSRFMCRASALSIAAGTALALIVSDEPRQSFASQLLAENMDVTILLPQGSRTP